MNWKIAALLACAMAAAPAALAQTMLKPAGGDAGVDYWGKPLPKASMRRLEPELEEALVGVLAIENLLLEAEELCRRTLPTSFSRYRTAASNWRQRNSAVLGHSRRVLAEAVNASQRRYVQAAVKESNERSIGPMLKAPAESRMKWCDSSFRGIDNGDLDFAGMPKLAKPLMSYRSGTR